MDNAKATPQQKTEQKNVVSQESEKEQPQAIPQGKLPAAALIDPTPHNVLRLQRLIGNRRTHQLLRQAYPLNGKQNETDDQIIDNTNNHQSDESKTFADETPPTPVNANHPHLQRETKTGAGVAISTNSVKLAFEATYKFPERAVGDMLKVQLEAGATSDVELVWDTKATASATGEMKNPNEGGFKMKANVWKDQAKAQAEEEISKQMWDDHFSVDKVDVEVDLLKYANDPKKGGGKGSSGIALVVSTKAGDKHKIFLNLYEAKMTDTESSVIGPHGGGEISFQLLPKFLRLADLPQGGRLQGAIAVKAKVTVKPNYAGIAKAIVQKYGPQIMQTLARSTAAQIAANPATWLIAGGVLTIAAYAAAIAENSEIKAMHRAAIAAVDGYCGGFLAGVGAGGSGGDPQWFGFGQAKGVTAMKAQILQIQQSPMFAPHNFSDAELQQALSAGVLANRDAFFSALYGAVAPKIKAMHVKKWRDDTNNSWLGKISGSAERNEKYLRTRLGLPDKGPLDEDFAGPESAAASSPSNSNTAAPASPAAASASQPPPNVSQ